MNLSKSKFDTALEKSINEITLWYGITYAYALMNKGLLKDILVIEQKVIPIIKILTQADNASLESISLIALFKNSIGNAYLLTNDLEPAYRYYSESLTLRERLNDSSSIADSILNIGLVHYYKGEYELALDHEKRALEKYKEINDKFGVLNTTVNLAVLLYNQGKWDDSIEIINESMELAISYKNIKFVSALYQILGDIYENKGDFDKAIESLNQSYRLKEKLNNPKLLGDISISLSHLYIEKNDSKAALEHIHKALRYYTISGDGSGIIIGLFWQFWIYIGSGNKTQIEQSFLELQEQCTNSNNQRTNQILLVAHALYSLYHDNSAIDEIASTQLKTMLDNDKIIDIRLSIIAITLLCTFKLYELKQRDEKSLEKEILSIIESIYALGLKINSYKFMVLSYILQMKFNVITGNIEKSFEALKKGLELAGKYDLNRLIEDLKDEETELTQKIERWYGEIPINPPLAEKIDESNILDYLKDAMKLF